MNVNNSLFLDVHVNSFKIVTVIVFENPIWCPFNFNINIASIDSSQIHDFYALNFLDILGEYKTILAWKSGNSPNNWRQFIFRISLAWHSLLTSLPPFHLVFPPPAPPTVHNGWLPPATSQYWQNLSTFFIEMFFACYKIYLYIFRGQFITIKDWTLSDALKKF